MTDEKDPDNIRLNAAPLSTDNTSSSLYNLLSVPVPPTLDNSFKIDELLDKFKYTPVTGHAHYTPDSSATINYGFPALCYCSLPFNRSNPRLDVRGAFEQLYSDFLFLFRQRHPEVRHIRLAHLGSSNLGEVVIIAELLKQHGFKSAHIDAVDSIYESVLSLRSFIPFLRQPPSVDSNRRLHKGFKSTLYLEGIQVTPSKAIKNRAPKSTARLNALIELDHAMSEMLRNRRSNSQRSSATNSVASFPLEVEIAYHGTIQSYSNFLNEHPAYPRPEVVSDLHLIDYSANPEEEHRAIMNPLLDTLASAANTHLISVFSPTNDSRFLALVHRILNGRNNITELSNDSVNTSSTAAPSDDTKIGPIQQPVLTLFYQHFSDNRPRNTPNKTPEQQSDFTNVRHDVRLQHLHRF